jgi:hypothetical protein
MNSKNNQDLRLPALFCFAAAVVAVIVFIVL